MVVFFKKPDLCFVPGFTHQWMEIDDFDWNNLNHDTVICIIADAVYGMYSTILDKSKQELIARSRFETEFGLEYKTLFHKMNDDRFQVFGVDKILYKSISNILSSRFSFSVLPLQVHVEMCCNSDFEKSILCITEISQEFYLTIHRREIFSAIYVCDSLESIAAYMRRLSLDFFKKQGAYDGESITYATVTNSYDVGTYLSSNNLISHSSINVIDLIQNKERDSVFDFIAFERMQTKYKDRIKLHKYFCMGVLVLLVGCVLAANIFLQNSYLNKKKLAAHIKSSVEQQNMAINEAVIKKYHSWVTRAHINYGSLYYEVLNQLPKEYQVHSFSLQKNGDNYLTNVYALVQDSFSQTSTGEVSLNSKGVLVLTKESDSFVNGVLAKYFEFKVS